MPPSRNQTSRKSQQGNSQQDDTPLRTRAGRGGKAPSKPARPDVVLPDPSPTKLSPTTTRKTTRSASNISGRSFETAPEVYASYEHPLLMVFGLSPEFFDGLKKHHGKLPKERKVLVGTLPQRDSTSEEQNESDSDAEEQSAGESEVEASIVSHAAPRGRGRGGRGSRGGRGRGTRGRGRGGRARGGLARINSPVRGKPIRNAAPMVPLTEEEDEAAANQTPPVANAKPNEDEHMDDASESDDANEQAMEDDDTESDDEDSIERVQHLSITPASTPLPGLQRPILDGTSKAALATESRQKPNAKNSKLLAVPKIFLSSGSRTLATTPAVSAVPKLLNPEDDVLSDSDLPEPWINGVPSPVEADCEDRADYLLQTRYKPMVDVQEVIAALTKHPVSQRSTESLYALAANTQNILKAWQDQFLTLDARTAPHMNPVKKPSNGGRLPVAPEIFEDMKEADLYGYVFDPKKDPGCQDPWAQRPGAEKNGGRELRTRRNRDMLDSAAPSEEDDDEDNEGRPAKRQRRATRKYDGTDTGTGGNTPKKHSGWGGARKKGVSRFLNPSSETPEPEGRPTKPARTAASNLLHHRIQAMREETLVPSSGDEESSAMDVDDYSDSNVKRGRPAGSKNVARRSDYGVKKGPRKKMSEASTPVPPSAHGPNAPPPALQSMSEGQGQFTLDSQRPPDTITPLTPNPVEAVFNATSRPSTVYDTPTAQPDPSNPADAYMMTAPLSLYTNNYGDDVTSGSGSRRKPRVKSEKRSQSMTIWWAERKARKRELDEKNGTPVRTPSSTSNSASGKRGGRASTGSAAPTTSPATLSEGPRPASMHQQEHSPPDSYAIHRPQPPYTASTPLFMYASAPPPHPMMLQHSPLAALPSGYFPFSGPPPLGSQYGPRALAPAPLAPVALPNQPNYPSPYGPQSPASSRPKSSGQPPRVGQQTLAPAPPHHFSPYAPISVRGDVPFKVMVSGPAPAEARRGSR